MKILSFFVILITIGASSCLNAGVFDCVKDFLAWPIHCETIPALSYYAWEINDNANLPFPIKEIRYGYSRKYDKDEMIEFFIDNLIARRRKHIRLE